MKPAAQATATGWSTKSLAMLAGTVALLCCVAASAVLPSSGASGAEKEGVLVSRNVTAAQPQTRETTFAIPDVHIAIRGCIEFDGILRIINSSNNNGNCNKTLAC